MKGGTPLIKKVYEENNDLISVLFLLDPTV